MQIDGCVVREPIVNGNELSAVARSSPRDDELSRRTEFLPCSRVLPLLANRAGFRGERLKSHERRERKSRISALRSGFLALISPNVQLIATVFESSIVAPRHCLSRDVKVRTRLHPSVTVQQRASTTYSSTRSSRGQHEYREPTALPRGGTKRTRKSSYFSSRRRSDVLSRGLQARLEFLRAVYSR